jgi:putative molybdopterin biosynthesis protein
MNRRLVNALAAERASRGWTQARAAAAAGITRQSYAAIEAGGSVPSTEVALRLAGAMGVPVERLFRLPGGVAEEVCARWGGGEVANAVGRRVRLVRIGGRPVVYGLDDVERPIRMADGWVSGMAGDEVRVTLLPDRGGGAELAVVGCDPSFGIVAEALRERWGFEVVWSARGSRAALEALARGEAHIAGAHLHDPAAGRTNEPWIRELIPFACTRIEYAVWEEGMLLGPGNPHGIRGVGDLARPGVRLLNREAGSGSRILLDQALTAAGISSAEVTGYGTVARGHLALGEAIASGLADVGVGIIAAGATFGLDTIPLRTERYELIIPDHFLDLPAVGALLDLLRSPNVRSQVGAIRGYDVTGMGRPA